jgi:hypothetical protein
VLEEAQTLLAPGVTLRVGSGFTFTVTVTGALKHPKSSPVTVYSVVEPGLAVGVEQLVQFNPLAVVHVYELAPLADKAALSPMHIE